MLKILFILIISCNKFRTINNLIKNDSSVIKKIEDRDLNFIKSYIEDIDDKDDINKILNDKGTILHFLVEIADLNLIKLSLNRKNAFTKKL